MKAKTKTDTETEISLLYYFGVNAVLFLNNHKIYSVKLSITNIAHAKLQQKNRDGENFSGHASTRSCLPVGNMDCPGNQSLLLVEKAYVLKYNRIRLKY